MRNWMFYALFLFPCLLSGQSPYSLPGTLTDEIAERWDILYEFDHPIFASQRNTSRKEMTSRALQISMKSNLSILDKRDLTYILNDNTDYREMLLSSVRIDLGGEMEQDRRKIYDSTGAFYYLEDSKQNLLPSVADRKPILGYFYKTPANFFEVNEPNFSLRINPIVNFKYGNGAKDSNTIFQNTRGAEIRGLIDDKIYFYTSILENQARFNNYLERRIDQYKTIGGQGFYKDYKSAIFESLQGYDYLNAQAYVGINATKSVAIEFGHGKHFIGNGMRSLLLSDYSNNYFYLKFNTRIWKFHYQNIFAELAPISSTLNPGNKVLPKKYMANHYLSFKPNQNFEIGIFEAVVFAREDHFEFQYLNPIILYRTVEQFLDSPDNALIGLNAKWNFRQRFQLYGQLMLDEFKLSEITSGNGWWANKYGLQTGIKYINVGGIDHLDVQLEYNKVRPYTYAHRDSLTNFPQLATASYSHFNQPLAHPLGANFSELIANIRYRPKANIFINARLTYAKYGQDGQGENNGGNILLITGLRNGDFGNTIAQGIKTNMMSMQLNASYQFFHNYFFDLDVLYRNANADLNELDIDTKYIGGGLRINLGNIVSDY